MQLPPPSRALLFLLFSMLLVLMACNSSPLASPPAEPLPTASAAPPPGASVDAPTAAPAKTPTLLAPTATLLPPGSSQAACPPTHQVDIDPAAVLELGPGPGINPTTAAGEKLVIDGAVLAADCTPLVGITLNVWQTDANGEYGPGHGSNDMRCCYLMGSLRTDANGRYRLITTKPAHYKGEQIPPPAHIHVEIHLPQAAPTQTEIVFTGDPYLPRSLQGYTLVTPENVSGSDGAADYLLAVADIFVETTGN